MPHSNRLIAGPETEPRCPTIGEFREQHAGDRELLEQLRNKVKICKGCGKACAFTMKTCNACGNSIVGHELSYNDNVFMGFIYGVGRGKFPYSISIRRESPDFLAFDDPLSMTVCHLCVIPSSVYIPDLRYLFTDPVRGLELVNDLAEFGAKAALGQWWGHEAIRHKYFCGNAIPSTTQEVLDCVMGGFNFPPSMYQLHFQFVHLPLYPFHLVQAQKGVHFCRGRYFSLEYIRAALAFGEAARMEISESTGAEDIVGHFQALGLDYDAVHDEFLRKAERLTNRFDCWKDHDFELTVNEDHVISNATGKTVAGADPKAILRADDKLLRNYGRPCRDGDHTQCTLSYYSYAKAPHEVKPFVHL